MRDLPNDYVIEAVAWNLPSSRPGSRFTLEEIRTEFWTLFNFLQSNGLTKRTLAYKPSDITEVTELKAGDLTDEGIELIRTGYQKWLAALDRAGPTNRTEKAKDTKILERSLTLIRANS